MNEKNINKDCPVWRTMQIMGSKWAMLILFHLSQRTHPYGELKRAIPQVSEKVLNEELKNALHSSIGSKSKLSRSTSTSGVFTYRFR